MSAPAVMVPVEAWLQTLASSDAPALPAPWAMQLALTVGWAMVLALVGAVVASSLSIRKQRLVAASLALWTLSPGIWSPDYWLGLAFHAPSSSAMLLCIVGLWRTLGPPRAELHGAMGRPDRASIAGSGFLVAALLLGYGLLLDTFAVFPLQVYAWGFSPALLLVSLALALLPWVMLRARRPFNLSLWLAPLVLLLFAATRLPTGNLWDAMLDPWLWLAVHVVLLQRLLRR